jgi:hypothetical protein
MLLTDIFVFDYSKTIRKLMPRQKSSYLSLAKQPCISHSLSTKNFRKKIGIRLASLEKKVWYQNLLIATATTQTVPNKYMQKKKAHYYGN